MKYKLLALDMDGTLLNSKKQVTEKTAAAIERISRQGVHVCLATGRGLIECEEHLPSLKAVRYGVLNSGAHIFDFAQNESLAIKTVDPVEGLKYIKLILKHDAMAHLHMIRGGAAEEYYLKNMNHYSMGQYQEMFDRVCTPVDDIVSFAESNWDKVTKVCGYYRNVESRQKAYIESKDINLEFAFAEIASLEATTIGISKGSGLKSLCSLLGTDISEAVAVGDAPNDLPMLEIAGLPVAMGNASADVKNTCAAVTGDCDNDGIAELIDRLWP